MAKKILIFSTAYLPFVGGAELAVKEITDRINDFQFDMITLRFDSKLPKFERIGNINVHRIGFSKNNPTSNDLLKFPLKLNKLFFPFFGYLQAVRLHRKNKYDAVWAIMAAFAGFAAMFFKSRYPKIPYLLTLQEGDPIENIKKKISFIFPLFSKIFTKANFIQAISHYLAGWAQDVGFKGKMEVVPNAVNIEHFSQIYPISELEDFRKKIGKSGKDKYIITVSRLVFKNAVDDVIRSLPYLSEDIKFLILGIGPDLEKLKKLTKELKVADRVIFYGHVDHKELPEFLKISDVFVRPSLSEGLGTSFLEAMAAEIPVIATPVGGIPDFLKDGETGLFCEVRNPESIARKANLLFSDDALRQKLIVNGKKMIMEKYGWDKIALRMREIFGRLTA